MKQLLFVAGFLAFSGILYGQLGLTGAYKDFTANDWYEPIQEGTGVQTRAADGYAAGITYWFRLKNKRVEFLPELSFEKYGRTIAGTDYEHRLVGFYFNANFYPFDFSNDCDCPTWSKDGNFFTKGFFLQVSPGVWSLENSVNAEKKISDRALAWTLGAGAGLDIGLADFLTVTPMLKYYYSPNNTWKNVPDSTGGVRSLTSAVQQLFAGIRLGFNWKQEGGRGRRR